MASNVLTRAKSLFPDFTTGLHWHLWQHSGHDVNYPEYFCSPGRMDDDAASFRAQQTREMLWGHPLGWFPPSVLDRHDKCVVNCGSDPCLA